MLDRQCYQALGSLAASRMCDEQQGRCAGRKWGRFWNFLISVGLSLMNEKDFQVLLENVWPALATDLPSSLPQRVLLQSWEQHQWRNRNPFLLRKEAEVWWQLLGEPNSPLQRLLTCGTKKEKKRESVRNEGTYDQTMKEITQCGSDEGLESPLASTSKDSSLATVRGDITSKEKGLNAVGKNDFLSELVWRPKGSTRSNFALNPSTCHFPDTLQQTFPYHDDAQSKATAALESSPSFHSLFFFTHRLLLWGREHDHNPPLESLCCRRAALLLGHWLLAQMQRIFVNIWQVRGNASFLKKQTTLNMDFYWEGYK